MTTPMKTLKPTASDEVMRADILALIKRHLTPDTSDRFLAVAAQVVGQAMALQDQRKMTVKMAWDLILANIEAGNISVIESLHDTKGTA